MTVDGDDAEFDHDDGEFIVAAATRSRADDEFMVERRLRRHAGAGGIGVARPGRVVAAAGRQLVLSEPEGASTWFPANDHPVDKATYRFRVTSPDGVEAVANGVGIAGPVTDGNGTHTVDLRWTTRWRATSRRSQSATSRSRRRNGPGRSRAAQRLRRRRRRGGASAVFAPTGEMLDFYDDRSGPTRSRRTATSSSTRRLGLALETQTMSLFGREFVDAEATAGRADHRPRARPPVVRRPACRPHVAGHLAERGLRHLRPVAVAEHTRHDRSPTCAAGACRAAQQRDGGGPPEIPGPRPVRRLPSTSSGGRHAPGPAMGRRRRSVLHDPATWSSGSRGLDGDDRRLHRPGRGGLRCRARRPVRRVAVRSGAPGALELTGSAIRRAARGRARRSGCARTLLRTR